MQLSAAELVFAVFLLGALLYLKRLFPPYHERVREEDDDSRSDSASEEELAPIASASAGRQT